MKQRVILICAAFVLFMAVAAKADTIFRLDCSSGGLFTHAERSSYDATYDKIVVILDGFANSTRAGITAIEGTWTTSVYGSAGSFTTSNSSLTGTWHNQTSTSGARNTSFVNFAIYNAAATWGRNAVGTQTGHTGGVNTTVLTGGWTTGGDVNQLIVPGAGDTDGDGINENVIAWLYVTKNIQRLQFYGPANYAPWGDTDGRYGYVRTDGTAGSDFLTFGTLPEPGTFVLLGTSLLGLLAYAWRRRK
jgi:hypothetical protein